MPNVDTLFQSDMWKGKEAFVIAEVARLYGFSCRKVEPMIQELLDSGKVSVHYKMSSNKRVTPFYVRFDPLSHWFITCYKGGVS